MSENPKTNHHSAVASAVCGGAGRKMRTAAPSGASKPEAQPRSAGTQGLNRMVSSILLGVISGITGVTIDFLA